MIYLDEFKNWLNDNGKRKATINEYSRGILEFSKWYIESINEEFNPLNVVTLDVKEYKQYLLTRNFASSTINKKILSVKSYFNFLFEKEIIKKNPSQKIKVQRVQNQGVKWLEKSEKNQLIRTIENIQTWNSNEWRFYRNKAIVYCMLLAGLRVGEVANLTLNDVNFKQNIIYIRDGKGGKGRIVFLNKGLKQHLKDWLELRNEVKTEYIFTSQMSNAGITIQGIEHIFRTLRKRSGLNDLTPHTLRHTFAHDLVEKGENLIVVAMLLGHEDINTTKIYTYPSQNELKKAVEKL